MKESDIRPQALFNRYLDLVRRDVALYFTDQSGFIDVACPACGGATVARRFVKDGFGYRECADCFSLYQSPRPSGEALARFYQEAESVHFWGTEFYRETAEARREKLFAPRARDVAALADRHLGAGSLRFLDIGPGYGTFLEEVARLNRFAKVGGVEPAPSLAELCRAKGFEIIEQTVEKLPADCEKADLVTAFEVLEHVSAPREFLAGLRRILAPGGITLLTTLTADGFDIQTLWQHAKGVYPPHHINLLSVAGYERLLADAGFELVEISTPGRLDVDIVRNTLNEFPEIDVPPFLRRIVLGGDEARRAAFQQFLAANSLSSHIRIIAKAKEAP